jgi:hypothetical protein
MKTYQTLTEFKGYVTKDDKTNADKRVLVSGSQNVLINSEEKIATRGGYELKGVASSNRNPIESTFTWLNNRGVELPLRSYDDELEVYLGTVDGVIVNAWKKVADGWSTVDFNYTTWWDATEVIDLLLFVNGDSNIYDWSGAVTTLKEATVNTITKNGTDTFGNDGFLTTGTRSVEINGTTYLYTGGEGTTTLTGVTPDPSGEAVNSVVSQSVRTNTNKPASGLTNDFISNLNNQIYVGSEKSRVIYVSSNTDFNDYTFSSPRVSGEGALLTLDGVCSGFAPLDTDMIVFVRDGAFKTQFRQIDVGGTLSETLEIKKFTTGSEQGAISQGFITNIGSSIAYVTNEPALRTMARVEDAGTVKVNLISDPVKPDFDNGTFTNGDMEFHKNQIYITLPPDGKVLIYDIEKKYWQPPQILPVRKLSIINSDLHGHSNVVTESYKLFTGTNDNELPFKAVVKFAYRTFGDRTNYKRFTEHYTEGYIKPNTRVKLTLNYDLDGSTKTLDKVIDGSDTNLRFESQVLGSLGQQPLGQSGLGGGEVDSSEFPKFRHIAQVTPTNFHELQVVYETNQKDYQFEILAQGSNVLKSRAGFIKNNR